MLFIFSWMSSNLHSASLAERCHCNPPPIFIIVTTLLQITTFCYHMYHFYSHRDHKGDHDSKVPWFGPRFDCSILVFNPNRRYEVWRYLSYGLVHVGVVHLVINVLLQLVLGLVLEMTNGFVTVMVIYVSSIFMSAFGTSTFWPRSFISGG